MPPRTRKPADEKPADLKDILWKAADKLRGSMDAAEYKHFVLGLIFLKYASDAFDERRKQIAEELEAEGITGDKQLGLLEDPDEYARKNIFWVPAGARWNIIAERAKSGAGQATVGQLLDGAMHAIGEANEDLKGALPQGVFNGRGVDARRLGELVDLINKLGFKEETGADGKPRTARDILGEVYEYCLEKFALAEGKRGGEYFTPKSIVKLIVEILEPHQKERVYDPACGSGGMFVQAEKFIEAHGGNPFDISVFGQESNQNTWRLAKMNLAIHGISANLGPRWGDSFHEDHHPDLRADLVMANPPFNISDWGGERLPFDPRWEYGVPPVGNANYAWLQHMAHKLSAKGRAGIVLANGSMSSKQSGEGDIRRAMVEDGDLVTCMVALPGQLFRSTGIPVCIWFLAKDKSAGRERKLIDRTHQYLFIDARNLGVMVDRTLRELTDDDIKRIADTYHAWRGTDRTIEYVDVPGFCKSATVDEVRDKNFSLLPEQYIDAVENELAEDLTNERIEVVTNGLLSAAAQSETLIKAALVSLQELAVISAQPTVEFRRMKLADVSQMISRGVAPRYVEAPDGIVVLNQKCIRERRINLEPARRTLEERVPANKLLKYGDVLVNSTGVGTLGRVSRWLGHGVATVDSHITIVRFNPDSIDPALGAYLLLALQPVIERMGEGSTGQTELSRASLGSLELRIPVGQYATAMVNALAAIEGAIEQSVTQTGLLADTRDLLLPKLISGDL